MAASNNTTFVVFERRRKTKGERLTASQTIGKSFYGGGDEEQRNSLISSPVRPFIATSRKAESPPDRDVVPVNASPFFTLGRRHLPANLGWWKGRKTALTPALSPGERGNRAQRLARATSWTVRGVNARIFRGILTPALSTRRRRTGAASAAKPATGWAGRLANMVGKFACSLSR
jgi:hypothetical protein